MSRENQNHGLSGNGDHRYALFIGCTIPLRENNYETSARAVASALGIEITEIQGQSCCGLPFRSVDFNAWITLAARNLAIADKSNHPKIMTLCNGCYKSLLTASKELQTNEKLRQSVSKRLSVEGLEARGGTEVRHIAQVLHDDYGIQNIRQHVKRPLGDLKVAIHPGCHIAMPSKIIGFDNPAFPKKLDALVEVTGAKPIEYETKRLCCGATIVGIKEEISKALVRKKIENVTGKADALAPSVVATNFSEAVYSFMASGMPGSSLIGDMPSLSDFTTSSFMSTPMTLPPARSHTAEIPNPT